MIRFIVLQFFLFSILFSGYSQKYRPDRDLSYCVAQVSRSLTQIPDYQHEPNNINHGDSLWHFTRPGSWTSGFWPGILWYVYEYTQNSDWALRADSFTRPIIAPATRRARSHDVGFLAFTSIGNGYRLSGNPVYKNALLKAADSVAWLFNPKVGTFLSWPNMVTRMGWPHNTIIDNMMNMELLFWASKNGGDRKLYDIAVSHAVTTMKNHFRPDYTSYHVVVYDTATGKKIKGVTHQGLNDNSMWARGQAWAIYGYTMVYRETKDLQFLNFAQKVADVYLHRLPKDLIPHWDFDDPAIPNAPRDASAAAVVSSALLELSTLVENKAKGKMYYEKAVAMLMELSSERYQSRNKNNAFLLHSTGHKPNGGEIDASIIYADYYYIEALLRLKNIADKAEHI